jgi:hypothetical protein
MFPANCVGIEWERSCHSQTSLLFLVPIDCLLLFVSFVDNVRLRAHSLLTAAYDLQSLSSQHSQEQTAPDNAMLNSLSSLLASPADQSAPVTYDFVLIDFCPNQPKLSPSSLAQSLRSSPDDGGSPTHEPCHRKSPLSARRCRQELSFLVTRLSYTETAAALRIFLGL